MESFALNTFKGMLPKVSAKLLPEANAQQATNCKIDSGRLVPFKQHTAVQSIDQGSTPHTIYDLDGTWLSWDMDVDVEPSLLPDVYEEMVEQLATGGSTTTLVDTKINFVAAGISPGMTVENVTNGESRTINSITTTTQPNDTLNFSAMTATSSGHLYKVIDEDTVDDRFYYTGDGVPKQSNKTLALPVPALQGPAQEYNLGMRKPPTSITVSLGGAPTGEVEKSVTYTYTFINVFGEESQPANASSPVDIEVGHTVTLSNIDIPANALEGVEYVRIYRSVTGTNKAQYQLVDQLPASDFPTVSDTYEDTVDDLYLGPVLSSQLYYAPVDGLTGLTKFNNSVYAGFYKNTVWFSEPNKPHAWPYPIDLPYEVVAIATFDNHLIVGTTGVPFVITGEDPASVSVTPLKMEQPCFFKKGMTSTPYGVFYVCPDGIQQIMNEASHKVVTEEVLGRGFFPSTKEIELVYSDGLLYMFHTDGSTGYYLDLRDIGAGLFSLDMGDTFVFTGWTQKVNDLFMVGVDAGLYTVRKWDSGANTTMTWKSKQRASRRSGDYKFGKIIADGPVTFSYYIDTSVQAFKLAPPTDVFSKVVSSGDNFRLPSRVRGRVFEFAIESSSAVDYAGIGNSAHDFA